MTRREMEAQINDLVVEIVELDSSVVNRSLAFKDGPEKVDSLALIELAEAIEQTFEIKVDDTMLDELYNLGDVYDLVARELGI